MLTFTTHFFILSVNLEVIPKPVSLFAIAGTDSQLKVFATTDWGLSWRFSKKIQSSFSFVFLFSFASVILQLQYS